MYDVPFWAPFVALLLRHRAHLRLLGTFVPKVPLLQCSVNRLMKPFLAIRSDPDFVNTRLWVNGNSDARGRIQRDAQPRATERPEFMLGSIALSLEQVNPMPRNFSFFVVYVLNFRIPYFV